MTPHLTAIITHLSAVNRDLAALAAQPGPEEPNAATDRRLSLESATNASLAIADELDTLIRELEGLAGVSAAAILADLATTEGMRPPTASEWLRRQLDGLRP